MSISYIGLDVRIHGLNLESEEELDALRLVVKYAIQDRLRETHSESIYTEVEVDEHAGKAE